MVEKLLKIFRFLITHDTQPMNPSTTAILGVELRRSLRSRVIAPLSLALSRKGRGKVLFECIVRFLSGCDIELFVRSGA